MKGLRTNHTTMAAGSGSGTDNTPFTAQARRAFKRPYSWCVIMACAVGVALIGLVTLDGLTMRYVARARIFVVGDAVPDAPTMAVSAVVSRINAQLASPVPVARLLMQVVQDNRLPGPSTIGDRLDDLTSRLEISEKGKPGRWDVTLAVTDDDPRDAEKTLQVFIDACRSYYTDLRDNSNRTILAALGEENARLKDEYTRGTTEGPLYWTTGAWRVERFAAQGAVADPSSATSSSRRKASSVAFGGAGTRHPETRDLLAFSNRGDRSSPDFGSAVALLRQGDQRRLKERMDAVSEYTRAVQFLDGGLDMIVFVREPPHVMRTSVVRTLMRHALKPVLLVCALVLLVTSPLLVNREDQHASAVYAEPA